MIVTRGASTDGSTYTTYVADSDTMYGAMSYYRSGERSPAAISGFCNWNTGDAPEGFEKPQCNYAVTGYMNEYQVTIAESTFRGRPELQNPSSVIDYENLMVFALRQTRTAREAIRAMGELAEKHGFNSTGETYSVSDPDEAWILEVVGKGHERAGAAWVAVRIPDGHVSAHANNARIRKFPLHDSTTCLFSRDVISFAREKGYFAGRDEDFSFADAYAPANYATLRQGEARVWNLFRRVAPSLGFSRNYGEGAPPLPFSVKPDRKLAIHDIMELMRDHFEDTSLDLSAGVGAGPYSLPYRWHPKEWELDGVKYLNDRPISTQQTAFSFVAQMRSQLPNPIGGILWFGVDDTFSTVYMPIYSGIRKAPRNIAVGTGTLHEFSWDSAFWVFNVVANYAYSRYREMIVDIQTVQRELEGRFLAEQPETEQEALGLYERDPAAACDYLTDYSTSRVENTVRRWRKLWEALIVKYVDGNVKDEKGRVTQPGYPQDWYRRIVNENGKQFRLREAEETPPH